MSSRRNSDAPSFIPIGRIVGAFGIDGRFKVEVLTDFPERFDVGETIYIQGEPHKILWAAWHKSQVRLRIAALNTPEAVDELRWVPVEVPEDERPELDDDEYYLPDLIGCRVVTTEGRELGTLDQVIAGPAQDVLQVGDILIPAVSEFVTEIDLDEEVITVKLIPGMIPSEEGA